MTISELREKRIVAGIVGRILCKRAGIERSRLSVIEKGYLPPTAEELERLQKALDELIKTKQRINAVAAEYGWPVEAI
jgi:transcriptional regulator with XRE-family HTH domain